MTQQIKMNKTFFLYILYCFIFSSVMIDRSLSKEKLPTAVNGVLDLSEYNLDELNEIKLDGEWKYYKDANIAKENEKIIKVNSLDKKKNNVFDDKSTIVYNKKSSWELEIKSKVKLDGYSLIFSTSSDYIITINNVLNHQHVRFFDDGFTNNYNGNLIFDSIVNEKGIFLTKINVKFDKKIGEYKSWWNIPKIIKKSKRNYFALSFLRIGYVHDKLYLFASFFLLFIYAFSKMNIGFLIASLGSFLISFMTITDMFDKFNIIENGMMNLIFSSKIVLFIYVNFVIPIFLTAIAITMYSMLSRITIIYYIFSTLVTTIINFLLLTAHQGITDSQLELIANILTLITFFLTIKDLYEKRKEIELVKKILYYWGFLFITFIVVLYLVNSNFTALSIVMQISMITLICGTIVMMVAFYDALTEFSIEKNAIKLDIVKKEMDKLNISLIDKVNARIKELNARQQKVTKVFNRMENAVLIIDLECMICGPYSAFTKNIFSNIGTVSNFILLIKENIDLSQNELIEEIHEKIKNKTGEIPNITLKIKEKYIEICLDPIINDENLITHYIVIGTDITKQKEQEDLKAQQLNIALTQIQSKEVALVQLQDPQLLKFLEDLNVSNYLEKRLELDYYRPSMILQDEISSLEAMATSINKPSPEVRVFENGVLIHKDLCQTIKDVMVHCLRNSLDHGIENELERLAKGKKPAGLINLDFKENIIKIYDDGRGINLKALRDKINKSDLSDSDVVESIFLSGMSTASKVTDISGRGVGMDAVRSFIMEKGGKIEIVFIDDIKDRITQLDFRPIALKIYLPENMIMTKRT